MKEIKDRPEVKAGGYNNNLQCADGTILIAENAKDLQLFGCVVIESTLCSRAMGLNPGHDVWFTCPFFLRS